VTEADRVVDTVLKENLLREGEGWLSEETADNPSRLDKERCRSVRRHTGIRAGFAGVLRFHRPAEDGKPVAGGIYNPATKETFLGAVDCGLLYNGHPARPSQRKALDGAVILANRSEVKRGEWKAFKGQRFQVRAMGSVAYKLALVSAGLTDVTFTLTPKNEWDVLVGAALVLSAGGFVSTLEKSSLIANRRDPLLSGLLAGCP